MSTNEVNELPLTAASPDLSPPVYGELAPNSDQLPVLTDSARVADYDELASTGGDEGAVTTEDLPTTHPEPGTRSDHEREEAATTGADNETDAAMALGSDEAGVAPTAAQPSAATEGREQQPAAPAVATPEARSAPQGERDDVALSSGTVAVRAAAAESTAIIANEPGALTAHSDPQAIATNVPAPLAQRPEDGTRTNAIAQDVGGEAGAHAVNPAGRKDMRAGAGATTHTTHMAEQGGSAGAGQEDGGAGEEAERIARGIVVPTEREEDGGAGIGTIPGLRLARGTTDLPLTQGDILTAQGALPALGTLQGSGRLAEQLSDATNLPAPVLELPDARSATAEEPGEPREDPDDQTERYGAVQEAGEQVSEPDDQEQEAAPAAESGSHGAPPEPPAKTAEGGKDGDGEQSPADDGDPASDAVPTSTVHHGLPEIRSLADLAPGTVITFNDGLELIAFETMLVTELGLGMNEQQIRRLIQAPPTLRDLIKPPKFHGSLTDIQITVMPQAYAQLLNANDRGWNFTLKGGQRPQGFRRIASPDTASEYRGFILQARAKSTTARLNNAHVQTEIWYIRSLYPNTRGDTIRRVVAQPRYEARDFERNVTASRQIGFTLLRQGLAAVEKRIREG